MAGVIPAERMPATVLVARFVLTLEVAFGIVGLAFGAALAIAAVGAAFIPPLLYQIAITALQGWFLYRWRSSSRC